MVRKIIAVHNEQDEDEASSEEESDYEEADQEEDEEADEAVEDQEPEQEEDAQEPAAPAGKLKISLGKSKKSFSETATCHVSFISC